MLKIEYLENGNLKLSVPDRVERVELYQLQKERGDLYAWAELIEPYQCNGGPVPIDPNYVFVGLTDDPYMLAEEGNIEDNGDFTVCGRLWHYPQYMLRSIPLELARGRVVVLSCWHDTKGEPETRRAIH